jgi:hypothetical protein
MIDAKEKKEGAGTTCVKQSALMRRNIVDKCHHSPHKHTNISLHIGPKKEELKFKNELFVKWRE